MSEEWKVVYARRTKSGKGIRFRDNEVVYVASIRSIEAFLRGERDYIAFAKFPYRKTIIEWREPDTILTHCDTCGGMRIFRKVGDDKWECEECRTKKSTTELLLKIRQLVEGY
ncbi:MAG: hypothetical protein DRO11_10030 [Methanobacteriota archaeon]|nr:MAG: hypothetical protein DRO11_10030 [Euryarchaeota archaeon]